VPASLDRPAGAGTPDDDPAVATTRAGSGAHDAAAIGLPSGVGWPAGFDRPSRFGSLADLEHSLGIGSESTGNGHGPETTSLDAPTMSLPAIADRPTRDRTGGPATPGQREVPDEGPSTEDGLPRRVRQANLAPQLRRPAGAPQPEQDTQPIRSPEQIRSIMSALQHGTTRGRLDAARLEPPPSPAASPEAPEETGSNEAPSPGASFADAATVSFPALADDAFAAEEEAPGTGGDDAVDDRAAGSEPNDVTRPEKDA
jgi:hypothetical protein